MKKKKQNKVLHIVKLIFLRSYRKKYFVAKGEKIWQDMDQKLPLATGDQCQDKERLEEFSKMVKKLSNWKYYELDSFLEYTITECRKKIRNGRDIEAVDQKNYKIFWEHYLKILPN